jgi:hypothetical protein
MRRGWLLVHARYLQVLDINHTMSPLTTLLPYSQMGGQDLYHHFCLSLFISSAGYTVRTLTGREGGEGTVLTIEYVVGSIGP